MKPTIEHVISKDKTKISYRAFQSQKPGIIVVPGALTTAEDFDGLSRELSRYFSVFTIDRRGRGSSGSQGDDYSVTKEIEDIEAVKKRTGAVYLFGHSYGGFLSLEFARVHKDIEKLVVYEPGVSIKNSIPMGWAQEAQSYLEKGKSLDAFVAFVRAMNPDSTRGPRWLLKVMLPVFIRKNEREQKYALLNSAIREHAEEARLDSTHLNYQAIKADALIMRGGKINATRVAFDAITRDIPEIHSQIFEKLDHFGPERQPKELARAIEAFIGKAA